MDHSVQKFISSFPRPQKALAIPALALRSLTSKSGSGVYASSDTLFKGAVFGRDSLEVAEDLLQTKPRLVRSILLTLASLQGRVRNDANEEDPGKIIHEYRSTMVDGKPIDDRSLEIFTSLSAKWGGDKHTMAYYGSVDVTPHFIRTLHMYTRLHGNAILNHTVQSRDGSSVSMHEVVVRAIGWVVDQLDNSRSGLLEYHRRNPHGLLNQVWKDSEEFYVHENGKVANHAGPIASIEVQGLVYDALLAAADFFPQQVADYRAKAFALRDRTVELLWQPDRKAFALGLDYDPTGAIRIIQTATANPAALLDTGFFDELPQEAQQHYIGAIAEKIMGPDFLTDAGIRSRALSEAHLVKFWDYHGSFVSWPKETYDIAKGLRRQGFGQLARQLENRILNIILKNHEYPEFVYVDAHGRVLASSPSAHTHGELVLVDSTHKPERIQAWTVSAVMATISQRLVGKRKAQPGRQHHTAWQRQLEKKILSHIPRVNTYMNPFALAARYPTYSYRLNSD